MDSFSQDTIAAISTAPVMAAVGMIRVSGPRAIEVTQQIFTKSLQNTPNKSVVYGSIQKNGQVLDQVLVTVFRAPHSYTGEDVVEISCHGSVFVLKSVLELLIENGVRQAERGEFTKRAFVNGKMDLSQAEAVIDLIEAQSQKEVHLSVHAMEGHLSDKIHEIRAVLLDLCSRIFAYVDFPDDGMEDVPPEQMAQIMEEQLGRIEKLIGTYQTGQLIKNGIQTVICGKPNVGKSSLMNQLTGYDRSIVTSVSGTTRDIVSETISIHGQKFILSDTAGVHTATDEVERIGVERALSLLKKAQIVLFVADLSRPFDEEDHAILQQLSQTEAKKALIWNKSDLSQTSLPEDLSKIFEDTFRISAKDGTGVEEVRTWLGKIPETTQQTDDIAVNTRQYQCLLRAREALQQALKNRAFSPDILLEDLETAVQALAETPGKTVSAEIVEHIFSRFCVGK